MEWPKLKNIILTILLITNVFLLGLVGLREWNASRYQAEARENAAEILERCGIHVELASLPEDGVFPVATVIREQEKEAEMLTPLLGGIVETALGGGQYLYTGPRGEANLRGRGEFTVELAADAYPVTGTMEEYAVEVLTLMDFDGVVLNSAGDENHGSVYLMQLWEGSPVPACTVTVTYEQGSVADISGARLSGTPVSAGEVELSVVTGLLRFLEALSEHDSGCHEIRSIQVGYQLTTSVSSPSALTPAWYIVTDMGTCVLDVMTNQLKWLT